MNVKQQQEIETIDLEETNSELESVDDEEEAAQLNEEMVSGY